MVKKGTSDYQLNPLFLFLVALGVIFLVELLIMFLLGLLPQLPLALEAFLDAFILSLLVIPFLYLLLFKPVQRAIEQKNQREAERDKLQRIDAVKSHLIAVAAHELRTPIATIMGYTELLSDQEMIGSFSEKEKGEFLATIYERSERLSKIIDDILDVSRIESGQRLPLQKTPLSIKELLEKVIHRLSLKSRRQVILEIKPEVPDELLFDENRIEQVIENLLSNAIKYSSKQSPISVVAEADDRHCSITVTDQGIGMSDEQKSHIFDKFYRADSSNTAVQGLGLGMSIVKQIIDDHGGTITIDSTLGEGTSACFTLPRDNKSSA